MKELDSLPMARNGHALTTGKEHLGDTLPSARPKSTGAPMVGMRGSTSFIGRPSRRGLQSNQHVDAITGISPQPDCDGRSGRTQLLSGGRLSTDKDDDGTTSMLRSDSTMLACRSVQLDDGEFAGENTKLAAGHRAGFLDSGNGLEGVRLDTDNAPIELDECVLLILEEARAYINGLDGRNRDFMKAYSLFKHAARMGSVEAKYLLALFHRQGVAVKKDVEAFSRNVMVAMPSPRGAFSRTIEGKYMSPEQLTLFKATLQNAAGVSFMESPEPDLTMAADYFRDALEAGVAEASRNMTLALLEAVRLAKVQMQVLQEVELQAEQSRCRRGIPCCVDQGQNTPSLRTQLTGGSPAGAPGGPLGHLDPVAVPYLAEKLCCFNASSSVADCITVLDHLARIAVDSLKSDSCPDARIFYDLGVAYECGFGVDASSRLSEAVHLYEQADRWENYPKAQLALGKLYLRRLFNLAAHPSQAGVEPESLEEGELWAEGLSWLRIAAENGEPEAHAFWGAIYAEGALGVPPDPEESRRCFLAAENGGWQPPTCCHKQRFQSGSEPCPSCGGSGRSSTLFVLVSQPPTFQLFVDDLLRDSCSPRRTAGTECAPGTSTRNNAVPLLDSMPNCESAWLTFSRQPSLRNPAAAFGLMAKVAADHEGPPGGEADSLLPPRSPRRPTCSPTPPMGPRLYSTFHNAERTTSFARTSDFTTATARTYISRRSSFNALDSGRHEPATSAGTGARSASNSQAPLIVSDGIWVGGYNSRPADDGLRNYSNDWDRTESSSRKGCDGTGPGIGVLHKEATRDQVILGTNMSRRIVVRNHSGDRRTPPDGPTASNELHSRMRSLTCQPKSHRSRTNATFANQLGSGLAVLNEPISFPKRLSVPLSLDPDDDGEGSMGHALQNTESNPQKSSQIAIGATVNRNRARFLSEAASLSQAIGRQADRQPRFSRFYSHLDSYRLPDQCNVTPASSAGLPEHGSIYGFSGDRNSRSDRSRQQCLHDESSTRTAPDGAVGRPVFAPMDNNGFNALRRGIDDKGKNRVDDIGISGRRNFRPVYGGHPVGGTNSGIHQAYPEDSGGDAVGQRRSTVSDYHIFGHEKNCDILERQRRVTSNSHAGRCQHNRGGSRPAEIGGAIVPLLAKPQERPRNGWPASKDFVSPLERDSDEGDQDNDDDDDHPAENCSIEGRRTFQPIDPTYPARRQFCVDFQAPVGTAAITSGEWSLPVSRTVAIGRPGQIPDDSYTSDDRAETTTSSSAYINRRDIPSPSDETSWASDHPHARISGAINAVSDVCASLPSFALDTSRRPPRRTQTWCAKKSSPVGPGVTLSPLLDSEPVFRGNITMVDSGNVTKTCDGNYASTSPLQRGLKSGPTVPIRTAVDPRTAAASIPTEDRPISFSLRAQLPLHGAVPDLRQFAHTPTMRTFGGRRTSTIRNASSPSTDSDASRRSLQLLDSTAATRAAGSRYGIAPKINSPSRKVSSGAAAAGKSAQKSYWRAAAPASDRNTTCPSEQPVRKIDATAEVSRISSPAGTDSDEPNASGPFRLRDADSLHDIFTDSAFRYPERGTPTAGRGQSPRLGMEPLHTVPLEITTDVVDLSPTVRANTSLNDEDRASHRCETATTLRNAQAVAARGAASLSAMLSCSGRLRHMTCPSDKSTVVGSLQIRSPAYRRETNTQSSCFQSEPPATFVPAPTNEVFDAPDIIDDLIPTTGTQHDPKQLHKHLSATFDATTDSEPPMLVPMRSERRIRATRTSLQHSSRHSDQDFEFCRFNVRSSKKLLTLKQITTIRRSWNPEDTGSIDGRQSADSPDDRPSNLVGDWPTQSMLSRIERAFILHCKVLQAFQAGAPPEVWISLLAVSYSLYPTMHCRVEPSIIATGSLDDAIEQYERHVVDFALRPGGSAADKDRAMEAIFVSLTRFLGKSACSFEELRSGRQSPTGTVLKGTTIPGVSIASWGGLTMRDGGDDDFLDIPLGVTRCLAHFHDLLEELLENKGKFKSSGNPPSRPVDTPTNSTAAVHNGARSLNENTSRAYDSSLGSRSCVTLWRLLLLRARLRVIVLGCVEGAVNDLHMAKRWYRKNHLYWYVLDYADLSVFAHTVDRMRSKALSMFDLERTVAQLENYVTKAPAEDLRGIRHILCALSHFPQHAGRTCEALHVWERRTINLPPTLARLKTERVPTWRISLPPTAATNFPLFSHKETMIDD